MRSLAEQREELEEAEKDSRDKVRAAMGELTSCRTKIAQVPTYTNTHTHIHTYIEQISYMQMLLSA